jgi:uncharacterized protein
MFSLDGQWVASASDLVVALRCEYQLLARRAERAGLVPALEVEADALLARASVLGLAHEEAVLRALVADHGEGAPGGVVSIAQPSTKSRAELEAAAAQTRQAMADGAAVVYQGAFFDGTFHGLADFLVRVDDGVGPVRYEPADTKFARHARVEALLQLASYASQLEALGLPTPREVHLWLGDGTKTHHRYADLRPILVDRWARLRTLLDEPVAVPEWGSPALRWCGWCDHCRAAADARRDVLLVAGVRVDQRKRLVEAGVTTIEDLAAADPSAPTPGVKAPVFAKLAAQARLQAAQDASRSPEHPDGVVAAELADPSAIALLPPPNPGDVFFDFEGDPLHLTEGWTDLGLEYLFGVLTHGPAGAGPKPEYWPIWAHDRAAERAALEQFLDWLAERRRRPGFAGLHVYHYAPYEVTALKRLVQRYGTRAEALDQLLTDGVFVDLYGIVRRGVRVSQRSYSIKKLEPLYMGDDLRESDVTGGAESVVAYAEFRALREAGDAAGAAAKLDSLRSYNEYDCLSTLRLRDWLLSLPGAAAPVGPEAEVARARSLVAAAPGAEAAGAPAGVSAEGGGDGGAAAPSPAAALAERLRGPLRDVPPADRTPAQQAVALLAAALEYHRREVLPFWWDHFRRVGAPPEDWETDGEMIVIDRAEVEVVAGWHRPKTRWTRTYRALVDLPGSFKLTPGERSMFAIHDAPLPSHATQPAGTDRGYAHTISFDAMEAVGERCLVTLTETLPGKVVDLEPEHDAFPVAVSADAALEGKPMAAAILELARTHLADDGALAPHPALDLLQRLPPRLVGDGPLPAVDGEGGDAMAAAITAAVRRLDRSYLAVQGPPGTGKSTTGSKVIAELIQAHGWKVGVVAQSHRTVEALMDKVVGAGVDPARVLKRESGGGDHLGTPASDADLLACATAPRVPGESGCLIGGTSWDFVSDKRVPAGSLDLLVVDEAGQFSLADTLAVSRVAPRLLLLGDPQQLPQVSAAQHPEPVDRAALDWLAHGHDTLLAELGYFLDRTYRMRPELTAIVSHLAYDDRLRADPCTSDRTLDGIAPGLHTVLVDHQGNRAASPEEVDRIIELIEDLLGRTWTDPHDHDRDRPGTRPLEPSDLLVVAPFNAQVNRLRERLDAAGHPGVAVGTVDKFQGREAPVAIVSMAASAAANSARGAGFLLSRHRLNVAISRAQHSAFLVHAPQLTDFVPPTPAGLARLGAFLGVSLAGRPG